MRRRGAGAASESDAGSTSPNTPSSTSSSGGAAAGLGGSAFAYGSNEQGGHRIAYDPRDLLDQSHESKLVGGELPKLTLMEEVLLLGLKDRAGYLSFWNDNISYALRGCILIELALRRRIGILKSPGASRYTQPNAGAGGGGEKLVTVLSTAPTGETILDETLKMIKSVADSPTDSTPLSISSWIDLLSGETWNVMKIGFQLKQVRERLAKGLVDKGVLRTEKRNFLLFDMATHPVADARVKDALLRRLQILLTSQTSAVPDGALHAEKNTATKHLRAVCLASASYAASVLDNVFVGVGWEEQEAAFQRAEEILGEFSCWPWGAPSGGGGGGEAAMKARKRAQARVANGGGSGGATSLGDAGRDSVLGLMSEVRKESVAKEGVDEDGCFELVAGVLEVLGRLDSLL